MQPAGTVEDAPQRAPGVAGEAQRDAPIAVALNVGQRRVLNYVVEAATIVARFEGPIFGDLVVHASDVLMLAIRFHARRDWFLRAEVEVFNQRNAGLGVREGCRDDAALEIRSHVGHTSRASPTERGELQGVEV